MRVDLRPDELTVCEVIGRMRSLIARTSGVVDAKMGNHDGMAADVDGVIAEYAFAKRFNVFPDIGLSPRSGSYDGVYRGYRYDIKSTRYKTGRLLSTLKVNPDVDMYILAVIDGSSVIFAGWALKDELIQESNIRDLGHGKGYCMDQDMLRKLKDNDHDRD